MIIREHWKFLSILQCTVVPSGLFLFPLCLHCCHSLPRKSIPGNEKEEKIVIIKSALLGSWNTKLIIIFYYNTLISDPVIVE